MSLLSASNLAKSYGPVDLFSGVSLGIPKRARIGLVGANGIGKTTLFRILLGLEEPSEGVVQRSRGLRTGYLPQEAAFEDGGTLWETCLGVFAGLINRQAELARLEAALAAPGGPPEGLLETYGRLQHEFDHLGGYTYENRIRQTLTGLGFSSADEQRPTAQLSGGQRTRALLARLLLSNPDLLLLDEPTNHLDISAVEWLEAFLRDWEGAVVIISHDRYFLDQAVRTIWEMTPALETYHGNYSAYLVQRSERYTRRLEEYQTQVEFIEKEEDFIRRNIAGQNTRQAQGRRKRLERLLEEARLAPPVEPRRLHLKLNAAGRSGDVVLRTTGLSVGYADEGRPLFSVPDLVLQRRECAAILGPNGAGKTTFLKTLLGQVPPYEGEAVPGASLKIGYFAQAHEGLHPDWEMMQEIQAAAPAMLPAEVRSYLARFLFTGDDVFKTVSLLSGGERGRLALAVLALSGANLLLLDEPTNHLDLPSQEVLQSILAEYNGTILLVSHDRYLVDALATQIWEVNPQENRLEVFRGGYSDYRGARLQPAAAATAPAGARAAPAASPTTAPARKMSEHRRRQRLDALADEMAGIEARLKDLAARLENPPADAALVQRLGLEYVEQEGRLHAVEEEWGALAGE